PFNVIAPGRLLARSGILVHKTPTDARSGLPDAVAVPAHQRTPRSGFEGARVFPQPPVHVAGVADRHPDRVNARVLVGAEGRVLAERAVGVQRHTGASRHAPAGDPGLAARLWVRDGIPPSRVDALPVCRVVIELVGIHEDVFPEPAEDMRSA